MATLYSRSRPSSRYTELQQLYRDMHEKGCASDNLPPEKTYDGASLALQAHRIKKLVECYHTESILDYGCGKGRQYQPAKIALKDGRRFDSVPAYWGIRSVRCYDPAYTPFAELPQGRFDGVICTDVLEHCPEQDMPWILDELFAFASQFVFATVCCSPASKRLPNGENAHCTIRPAEWWQQLLDESSQKYPSVRYHILLVTIVGDAGRSRADITELSNAPDGSLDLI